MRLSFYRSKPFNRGSETSFTTLAMKVFFLILLALVPVTPVNASTTVSGVIASNTTWDVAGSPYVMSSSVTVSAGVTLTLAPGVVVKGLGVGTGLSVSGTLVANGTQALPIIFTSYKDDSAGGDTNNNGTANGPVASDWNGIAFNAGSSGNLLNNVVVRYAGYPVGAPFVGAGIYTVVSGLTVSNSTINNNGSYGIYVNGAAPTLTGNTIRNNGTYGIYVGGTLLPTILNNSIMSNGSHGLFRSGTTPVIVAKSNWWGSSSGPLDSSDDRLTGGWFNPGGSGNRVTDYVDYTPWLVSNPNAALTVTLSGYVRSSGNSQPIDGAVIQAGSQSATTNAAGRYIINGLANFGYAVTASRPGYTTKTSAGTVNPFTTPNYDITLTTDLATCVAGTLSGTVRDATTGVSLSSGITVQIVSGASTVTNAAGGYSFAGLSPGSRTITATVAGYSNFSLSLYTCGTQTSDLLITTNSTAQGLTAASGYSNDPVNTATGNYVYQRRDLQIGGKGMPFIFERNYNSQVASAVGAVSGPLGFGWTHNYNTSLAVVAGNVTITWGDGKTEGYASNGAGGFTAQYGVFDTLLANGDGTYTLKKKDLSSYNFNAAGRLASMADRNSNSITLTYTGPNLTRITDTSARNVDFTYDGSNRITIITDPIARTIQFTYDASGNLATARDARGNITTYAYDASHQITSVTNPRGNVVVTNVYDAAKRVVNSQKDAKLGQTTYTYDTVNNKTTIVDAAGISTIDYHDTLLRLIRQDDGKGNSTLYEYDIPGNRISVTDKRGNKTSYGYDVSGNVTSKVDALNGASTITYDAANNPLTRTDALGNVTQFTYDVKGNLLTATDALGNAAVMTYSAAGQVLTATDARNAVTTNTYDLQGNLTSIADTLTNATLFTYDGVGRRLTRQDALGRITTTAYDASDNVLSTTDPNAKSVSATYDANNNRVSATDKRGNVTLFTYDQKDLLTTTTDPLAGAVVTTYDAIDRKTSVTDKNNRATQMAYDPVGNLTSTTNALGQVTQYTYDANSNRLTVKDALNHITTSTYDALNRPLTTADALGNTANQTFDTLGRVINSTNAKRQTTSFIYDVLGRVTQVTDAANGTVKYTYDQNGNRLTMTDPNNRVTTYTYDALNRLLTRTEPLAGVTQYQYNAAGNRTRATLPNGTIIQYAYDALDRLQTVTYPDASTVTFAYDFDGNRTGMTNALGATTTVYDALGRMTSITDPFGQVVAYAFDANGNRTAMTYPGNKTVTYSFDFLSRLVGVTDWLTNQTSYTYDVAGRLTGATLPNGVITTYGFDNANRLTSLGHAKAATTIANYACTLDAIGNHTSVASTVPLATVVTPGTANYTYDTENRLTAINGAANTFDANGNMTAKGLNTYAYDFEDRLKQSIIGATTSTYQYDGLGNRYAATRASATTRYVLDMNGSLSKVLMETSAAGAPIAYYVYGIGLVSRISAAGAEAYYQFDSRGSTVALTDNTGAITDKYAYDPFGNLTGSTGTTANPFKYVGQYGVMDEGGELYYIRARYYDAAIRRFINKDPKMGKYSDGQSLHRYAYAQNNPVIFIDISGYSRFETGSVNSGARRLAQPSAQLPRTQVILDAGGAPLESIVFSVLQSAGKFARSTLKWLERKPLLKFEKKADYNSSQLGDVADVIEIAATFIENKDGLLSRDINVQVDASVDVAADLVDVGLSTLLAPAEVITGDVLSKGSRQSLKSAGSATKAKFKVVNCLDTPGLNGDDLIRLGCQ